MYAMNIQNDVIGLVLRKYDFNADLYLLQHKIWRDKKNINMTMNGGQIRFYLRI
jgi:hypothetical protein